MTCPHDTAVRTCKICSSLRQKKYRETHKEYLKQYNKLYLQKNRERLRELKRIYYLINGEEIRVQRKRWRQVNREKFRAYKKAEYFANRPRILQKQKERNQSIKLQVMDHYSDRKINCAHCGFNNINALSIDHVGGSGNKQRGMLGSGVKFYKWVIKNNYPGGFQVLCYNCNWLKRLAQQTSKPVKNERKNNTTKAYFLRMKMYVFQNYSHNTPPFCSSCGNNNLRVLSIDHLNGGGTMERKSVGFGSTFYLWLAANKFPVGYQVLCLNCQMIKRAK